MGDTAETAAVAIQHTPAGDHDASFIATPLPGPYPYAIQG